MTTKVQVTNFGPKVVTVSVKQKSVPVGDEPAAPDTTVRDISLSSQDSTSEYVHDGQYLTITENQD